MWMGDQRHAPAALPPRERDPVRTVHNGYRAVSHWLVQTNGQEVCGEDVLTSPGCEPRSIQPIA
jgi:hypothetical protein